MSFNQKPPIIVPLSEGIDMIFHHIPAGRFRMGQRGHKSNEEPVTEVEVGEFWMAEKPVDNKQYANIQRKFKDVIAESTYQSIRRGINTMALFLPDDSHKPVVQISFLEARVFSECVTKLFHELSCHNSQFIVSLPSERQWEYACRAGTETDFWSGDGEYRYEEISDSSDFRFMAPFQDVSQLLRFNGKRPNSLGLKYLHGGVWEMCNSVWINQANRIVIDSCSFASEVSQAIDFNKMSIVIRGGCKGSDPMDCRSARRSFSPADRRGLDLGFRLCILSISNEKNHGALSAPRDESALTAQATEGAIPVDLSKETLTASQRPKKI